MGRIIPCIMENKTCLKSPTRLCLKTSFWTKKICRSNQAASGEKKTIGHPTQGLEQSSAFRTRSATLWPCSLTTKSDFMAGLPQIIRFWKGINYLRRGGTKASLQTNVQAAFFSLRFMLCVLHLRGFYIQTLLHTNIFTPKCFYTQ